MSYEVGDIVSFRHTDEPWTIDFNCVGEPSRYVIKVHDSLIGTIAEITSVINDNDIVTYKAESKLTKMQWTVQPPSYRNDICVIYRKGKNLKPNYYLKPFAL